MPEKNITIDWLGSKEIVSGFFAAGYKYLDRTGNKVNSAMAKYRGSSVEALLMDLGHHARGLSDFQSEVPISICTEISLERSNVQLLTTVGSFYQRIGDVVEVYLKSLEHPEHLEKIEALRIMADHEADQPLEIIARKADLWYAVRRLITPHYSYPTL